MAQDLRNKYFVKNTENGTFADVTTLFDGVRVLKVDGFLSKGKPVNIYTAQWINEQEEDFLITTEHENVPIVIRENVDLEITFIVHSKYTTNHNIDVMTQHNAFVDYMTNSDVWVQSSYVNNRYVHCVCLKEYKPTTVKLQRGNASWVMGTLTLHTLDAPTQ